MMQEKAVAAVSLTEAFSPEELQNLVKRIIDSGALGRSRIYSELLQYLLAAACSGKSPKELEIALDVLGRKSDFDVTRDSVVRVYVHQLRKRLQDYYVNHEPLAAYRIIVPKGEYTLAVLEKELAATQHQSIPIAWTKRAWLPGVLSLIVVMLGANLLYLMRSSESVSTQSGDLQSAGYGIWNSLMNDDLPILLVMGDYYIFGELNEERRITRMIRDFNINSSGDLNNRFMEDPALAGQFMDLNLNYLPEGSAYALSRVMPVLHSTGKRINVTMMSRLQTTDLNTNHIVYLGYISALDKLNSLVFASSGLQTGRTFDELFNRGTGEIYSSDAGLPSRDQPFRDFGLLSTFPAPGGSQIIVIAGTRDAGLMHTAQASVDAVWLHSIEREMALSYEPVSASFEALFEVFGLERTNFDANLVYTRPLDARRIWSGITTER